MILVIEKSVMVKMLCQAFILSIDSHVQSKILAQEMFGRHRLTLKVGHHILHQDHKPRIILCTAHLTNMTASYNANNNIAAGLMTIGRCRRTT